MNTTQKAQTDTGSFHELTVFKVHEISCGLDINDVQEINKHINITRVYGAPEYVRGIINLRGQIVTVIDMRIRFGFEASDVTEDSRIVVIEYQGEYIGLLVDGIEDIVVADPAEIEPSPSNVKGITGEFFTSVLKTKTGLISIIDKIKVMD